MNGIATSHYREIIFSGRTGKILSQEVSAIKLLDTENCKEYQIKVCLLEDCYNYRRGQIVIVSISDYKYEN